MSDNVVNTRSFDLGDLKSQLPRMCGTVDGKYFKVSGDDHVESQEETSEKELRRTLRNTSKYRLILDGCGGAGVACFGNGKTVKGDEVFKAMADQYLIAPYAAHGLFSTKTNNDLGKLLVHGANRGIKKGFEDELMSNSMLLCSGSEATEAAIKLVWQYWTDKEKTSKEKAENEKSGKTTHKTRAKKRKIISKQLSYHGNTTGALSISDFAERQKRFHGLLYPSEDRYILRDGEYQLDDEQIRVYKAKPYYPYRYKGKRSEEEYAKNEVAELETLIIALDPETVSAFFLEPVTGAALGCQPLHREYLRGVKRLCRKYDILLVYDEVMCGLGRTGYLHSWHYYEGTLLEGKGVAKLRPRPEYVFDVEKSRNLDQIEVENFAPDIQMVGKCLGAGFVAAAGVMANERVSDGLKDFFSHGQTYQAHALTSAAALNVQQKVTDMILNPSPGSGNDIQKRGKQLEDLLKSRFKEHNYVGDIRGRGLFWGIEIVKNKNTTEPFHTIWRISHKIAEFGQQTDFTSPVRNSVSSGVQFYPGRWDLDPSSAPGDVTSGDHIMIMPSFTSTEYDIIELVDKLEEVLKRFEWKKYLGNPPLSM
ncbi:hypothetical protein JX265_011948 [Neoarthrinium moseri]|uniref:Aminotransferase n=1 Tax=Neoarthrinium moseri TaxID=1658444 RepID=A0A9Q0AK53_9PEZI|nr:hypothetical protein JX265_011948 [Neoarthrinium moseri]